MALVATLGEKIRLGDGQDKWYARGTLAFDNSYPTNGEALILSQVGLKSINVLDVHPTAGFVFSWDGTNKKVKAFYADYSTNTDGALIEVANATDLSALNAVPFEAIGRETA